MSCVFVHCATAAPSSRSSSLHHLTSGCNHDVLTMLRLVALCFTTLYPTTAKQVLTPVLRYSCYSSMYHTISIIQMLNCNAPHWARLMSTKSWFIAVYQRLLLVTSPLRLLLLLPLLIGLLVTWLLQQSLWILLNVGANWCALTSSACWCISVHAE